MGLVFLRRGAMPAVDLHAQTVQTRRYIVLRGERVAAGGMDFRAARLQAQGQIGGLGLHVDGHGDLFPCKGLFLFKPAADGPQRRHIILNPGDFHAASFRQRRVPNDAHNNPSVPIQWNQYTMDFRKKESFTHFS